jgi:protein-S-isoprenylcysteine O-methyltransferase Ste14
MHTVGVAIMLVADAQKYYELKHRKALITNGMFKWIRHPNYTGEMMIYASYAVVVWHWIPWVILAWVWCGFFAVNILRKEQSMSRYSEWGAYKARTKLLIPKIF